MILRCMGSTLWKPRWTAPVCTSGSRWARGIGVEQAPPRLCRNEDLTTVSDLLRDLNEARKSVAYGDIGLPELDAEGVASRIEDYIESISALIEQERVQ